MNERIQKLRELSVTTPVHIDLERAKIETEFYKENDGKYSIPVMRSMVLKEYFSKKTLYLGEGELIVGEKGKDPQASPTFPELCCHSVEDMTVMSERDLVSFHTTEEDRKLQAEEIIPFWKGRSMREKLLAAMTPEWNDCYSAGMFTEFMEQRGPGHTCGGEQVFTTGYMDYKEKIKKSMDALDFMNDPEAYDKMEELKEDANAVMQKDKEVYLAMPRIFRAGTAEWVRQILPDIKRMGFAGVLVRNYEELALAKETFLGSEIITDHNLYCYNDQAVRAFAGQGVTKNTVPLELNRSEIKRRYNEESMMMLYGYYPLMTSAQCVHANTRGCDKKRGLSYLKDRYQVQFPVKNFCTYCYNVVYNSLPVLLFSNLEELKKAGIRDFRMDFTMESAKETKAILKLYEEFADGSRRQYPKEWENRYTNGHYKRGVE